MENKSFEEIVSRLEEIKNELSNSNVNLEDLINLYEEGKNLSKEAELILANAKNRVEKLLIENDN